MNDKWTLSSAFQALSGRMVPGATYLLAGRSGIASKRTSTLYVVSLMMVGRSQQEKIKISKGKIGADASPMESSWFVWGGAKDGLDGL